MEVGWTGSGGASAGRPENSDTMVSGEAAGKIMEGLQKLSVQAE